MPFCSAAMKEQRGHGQSGVGLPARFDSSSVCCGISRILFQLFLYIHNSADGHIVKASRPAAYKLVGTFRITMLSFHSHGIVRGISDLETTMAAMAAHYRVNIGSRRRLQHLDRHGLLRGPSRDCVKTRGCQKSATRRTSRQHNRTSRASF